MYQRDEIGGIESESDGYVTRQDENPDDEKISRT